MESLWARLGVVIRSRSVAVLEVRPEFTMLRTTLMEENIRKVSLFSESTNDLLLLRSQIVKLGTLVFLHRRVF